MDENKKKMLTDLKNLSEAEGYVKGLSKAAMMAMKHGYDEFANELAQEGNEIADNVLEAADRIKKELQEMDEK